MGVQFLGVRDPDPSSRASSSRFSGHSGPVRVLRRLFRWNRSTEANGQRSTTGTTCVKRIQVSILKRKANSGDFSTHSWSEAIFISCSKVGLSEISTRLLCFGRVQESDEILIRENCRRQPSRSQECRKISHRRLLSTAVLIDFRAVEMDKICSGLGFGQKIASCGLLHVPQARVQPIERARVAQASLEPTSPCRIAPGQVSILPRSFFEGSNEGSIDRFFCGPFRDRTRSRRIQKFSTD